MALHWLPNTALVDGALATRLETVVSAWAKDWLGHEEVICRSAPAGDAAPREGLKTVAQVGGDIALDCDVASRSTLSGQLLKFNPPTSDLDPNDIALVDSLLEAATQALVATVLNEAGMGNHAETPSTASVMAYLLADVIVQDRWIGRLSLSRDMCVALRRSGLGAGEHRPASGSVDEALSGTEIGVMAQVGSLSLDLGALNSLSKGDVLVLEKGMDASFGVMIDGVPAPHVRARYVLTESADKKRPQAGLILEI